MRELKGPRKAKYGFQVEINGGADSILDSCKKLHDLRTNVLKAYSQCEQTWWFETPNSMGKTSINLYINSPEIYQEVKDFLEKDLYV